jgi:hypothetical protein
VGMLAGRAWMRWHGRPLDTAAQVAWSTAALVAIAVLWVLHSPEDGSSASSPGCSRSRRSASPSSPSSRAAYARRVRCSPTRRSPSSAA